MLEHYTFQLHPAVQSRLVNIPSIHRKCEELENWDSVNTIFKAVCKFWHLLAKFLVTGMSDISAGVTLNISFIWTMSQKSRKWKNSEISFLLSKEKIEEKSILWAWFSLFHQISWVRIRDWHILTNGLVRFTTDDRFNVLYKEGSFNWILQVSNNSPPPHKGRTFLANFRGGRKRGGNILRREIFPYSGSPGKPELSQM